MEPAHNNPTAYASPLRFDENRIRAAAIYCSDGRFGEHFDDFLHNGLGEYRAMIGSPFRAGRPSWPAASWPAGKKTAWSNTCVS